MVAYSVGVMEKVSALERMVELQRLIGSAQAELAATMASFVAGARREVLGGEFATDEIAVALHCGRGRVLNQVRLVETIRTSLPATWAVWSAGEIDAYTASRILDAAERLTDPETLAGFDVEAAERAGEKTAPQLSAWLARRVARLEPDQGAARHARAVGQRRVGVQLDLDGMGTLWATTTALDLSAIDLELTRLARALGADDPRSIEQRRVDLLVDRLLGRSTTDEQHASSGGPGPVVAVTVPVQSLLGLDDTPGEVSGNGAPVPASLAREVLARPGTLVYRLLTDPAGQLLDVTQLGRFPTAKLGFAVDIRDRTCVFPSCHRAAVLCDADHTIPHPAGPTSYANLGCLCRRHHRLKTLGLAKLKHVEPGVFEWTMPTGSRHTVHAEPQPLGTWPAECQRPPPRQPLHYGTDTAAPPRAGDDPEALTTTDPAALVS